jgi:hypothetical protein
VSLSTNARGGCPARQGCGSRTRGPARTPAPRPPGAGQLRRGEGDARQSAVVHRRRAAEPPSRRAAESPNRRGRWPRRGDRSARRRRRTAGRPTPHRPRTPAGCWCAGGRRQREARARRSRRRPPGGASGSARGSLSRAQLLDQPERLLLARPARAHRVVVDPEHPARRAEGEPQPGEVPGERRERRVLDGGRVVADGRQPRARDRRRCRTSRRAGRGCRRARRRPPRRSSRRGTSSACRRARRSGRTSGSSCLIGSPTCAPSGLFGPVVPAVMPPVDVPRPPRS